MLQKLGPRTISLIALHNLLEKLKIDFDESGIIREKSIQLFIVKVARWTVNIYTGKLAKSIRNNMLLAWFVANYKTKLEKKVKCSN